MVLEANQRLQGMQAERAYLRNQALRQAASDFEHCSPSSGIEVPSRGSVQHRGVQVVPPSADQPQVICRRMRRCFLDSVELLDGLL